jgi:hypothetical protein
LAAAAIGDKRIIHFGSGDPRQVTRTIVLAGALSCPLVAWRDGFVAATEVGQVFLFDANSATSTATPFQTELTPDRVYHWLTPAVVGEGDSAQLAISDGARRLHLVEFVAQPAPHLSAVTSVDVGPSSLVTPVAVIGRRVMAGTEDGRLVSFTAPELSAGEPLALGSRVAWGPHNASEGVLLATESGELMLVDAEGAIRWRRPLEHGELGGTPLVINGAALVLHVAGGLSRVNLADGAEASYTDLGQPAVAGPVALGEPVVVAAPDGTLLVVNQP